MEVYSVVSGIWLILENICKFFISFLFNVKSNKSEFSLDGLCIRGSHV